MREINRRQLYEEVADDLGLDIVDVEEIVVSEFAMVAQVIESGEYIKGVRLKGFGIFSPSSYKFVKVMFTETAVGKLLKKWKPIAVDNPDKKVGIKAMDLVRLLHTCEKLYKYKKVTIGPKGEIEQSEKVDTRS